MEQNEDRLPVLIVVLQKTIEYWEKQDIKGPAMKKLMLEARTSLAGVETAYANDQVLSSPYIYLLVAQLADTLDKLAPEHLYFGQHPYHAGQYGFWSDDTLRHDVTFLRA